ncbi:discoidin domain-containing protein [Microtetraspora sp. AC03309]|uniref:discoidin domain-containing protein n=1 Tax=Microtetraspora sp. AC03309 TaxID=2779376 RepID=UPI001E293F7F|nr:discoidin domain-containing protein [Microtetraspora sp. AC03309]MCC5575883.1 discoidin domain-containing protein [Microtetraspora sp. AC03309]
MRHPHLTAALAAAAVAALAGPAAAGTPGPGTPGPGTTGPGTAVQSPEPEIGAPAQDPTVRVKRGTSKGTGRLTPISGTDRLVAPLGVDPACPAKLEIGMRSDARNPLYADMSIELDQPLTASRLMLSSYLPPGYELGAKLLVAVPPATPKGQYGLRLKAGQEELAVPISVVDVGELDNGGNLALRRPVTASSQHTNANYPPCSVVDGDRSSNGWAGGNGWNDATSRKWPDTLDIALGEPRQISRVDLYTLDTERYPASSVGLRDWDVQARVDGQWRTVAQVRGNTAGMVRSDFTPVTTDAVRISALASNGANDYSRIIEIEVHS